MTEKQLAHLLVKVIRARQRFDNYAAKARKSGKVDSSKLISLATALRDAALAVAKV